MADVFVQQERRHSLQRNYTFDNVAVHTAVNRGSELKVPVSDEERCDSEDTRLTDLTSPRSQWFAEEHFATSDESAAGEADELSPSALQEASASDAWLKRIGAVLDDDPATPKRRNKVKWAGQGADAQSKYNPSARRRSSDGGAQMLLSPKNLREKVAKITESRTTRAAEEIEDKSVYSESLRKAASKGLIVQHKDKQVREAFTSALERRQLFSEARQVLARERAASDQIEDHEEDEAVNWEGVQQKEPIEEQQDQQEQSEQQAPQKKARVRWGPGVELAKPSRGTKPDGFGFAQEVADEAAEPRHENVKCLFRKAIGALSESSKHLKMKVRITSVLWTKSSECLVKRRLKYIVQENMDLTSLDTFHESLEDLLQELDSLEADHYISLTDAKYEIKSLTKAVDVQKECEKAQAETRAEIESLSEKGNNSRDMLKAILHGRQFQADVEENLQTLQNLMVHHVAGPEAVRHEAYTNSLLQCYSEDLLERLRQKLLDEGPNEQKAQEYCLYELLKCGASDGDAWKMVNELVAQCWRLRCTKALKDVRQQKADIAEPIAKVEERLEQMRAGNVADIRGCSFLQKSFSVTRSGIAATLAKMKSKMLLTEEDEEEENSPAESRDSPCHSEGKRSPTESVRSRVSRKSRFSRSFHSTARSIHSTARSFHSTEQSVREGASVRDDVSYMSEATRWSSKSTTRWSSKSTRWHSKSTIRDFDTRFEDWEGDVKNNPSVLYVVGSMAVWGGDSGTLLRVTLAFWMLAVVMTKSECKSLDETVVKIGSQSAEGPENFYTPRNGIEMALAELRERVQAIFGSVQQASNHMNTCGEAVDGDGDIQIVALHEALQAKGYSRTEAELCVVFRALDIPCNISMALTVPQFCRLDDWPSHLVNDAELQHLDKVLRALRIRRSLIDSMTYAESLVVRLHIANTSSASEVSVDDLLANCREELRGQYATEMAQRVVAPTGLRIVVGIITALEATTKRQLLATSILSHAIRICTSDGGENDGHVPTVLEDRLAKEVWAPLLEFLDPAASAPRPLDVSMLSAIHALFVQAKVPNVVAGESGVDLAPNVVETLRVLHASPSRSDELLHVVAAFRELEKSREALGQSSAGEVAALAAAFGGCRLLREQLAKLPHEASEFSWWGARLLGAWRSFRARFASQRQGGVIARASVGDVSLIDIRQAPSLQRFAVLARADAEATAAGFPAVWPDPPHRARPRPTFAHADAEATVASSSAIGPDLPHRVHSRPIFAHAGAEASTDEYPDVWPSAPQRAVPRLSYIDIGTMLCTEAPQLQSGDSIPVMRATRGSELQAATSAESPEAIEIALFTSWPSTTKRPSMSFCRAAGGLALDLEYTGAVAAPRRRQPILDHGSLRRKGERGEQSRERAREAGFPLQAHAGMFSAAWPSMPGRSLPVPKTLGPLAPAGQRKRPHTTGHSPRTPRADTSTLSSSEDQGAMDFQPPRSAAFDCSLGHESVAQVSIECQLALRLIARADQAVGTGLGSDSSAAPDASTDSWTHAPFTARKDKAAVPPWSVAEPPLASVWRSARQRQRPASTGKSDAATGGTPWSTRERCAEERRTRPFMLPSLGHFSVAA